MTPAQILTLLGMLTDTVSAQQQQVMELQAQVEALTAELAERTEAPSGD